MLLKSLGFFVLFFNQVLVQRVERRSSKKLENLDGSFKMPAKRLILGQVLYLSPDHFFVMAINPLLPSAFPTRFLSPLVSLIIFLGFFFFFSPPLVCQIRLFS